MATIQELEAQVDDLQQTIDAEQTQIKSVIDKLNQIIADLQAGGGTPEDLQRIADKIAGAKADLEGTITEPE